ncbi:SapB/AmfS family lanthipeptide [Streptomyces sp. URMC 126]
MEMVLLDLQAMKPFEAEEVGPDFAASIGGSGLSILLCPEDPSNGGSI